MLDMIAGRLPPSDGGTIALEDVVGRTVAAIYKTEVEGAFGEEPCITLVFTDGTQYGFIIPAD